VGLLDILTGRHQVKGPAPDRLFAISTAYVTLDAAHGVKPTGTAAIVFQALATSEFEATLKDMEEVVKATGSDSGTEVSTKDDSYGYRWMILRNAPQSPSVEDLAVGINAVSGSIESAGHGDRILCAVFAFRDAGDQPIYFIYNYKRGYWYPFVPKGRGGEVSSSGNSTATGNVSFARSGSSASEEPVDAGERSTERELQLKAQIGSELPIEPELERWFPLWGIPI
jgi:PspA associated protein B